MPKLYEYLGIMISFYAGDHKPIHVHGKHGGRECKALIHVRNGKVVRVEFLLSQGQLEAAKQKEFQAFVKARAADIVGKWLDHFFYGKRISPEHITRKI